MTTTDFQKENDYIKECKDKIALREAVITLRNTPEWQTIIRDLYCTVDLKSSVYMLAQVRQADSKDMYAEKIAAVGHFENFLTKIINEGNQAEVDLMNLVDSVNG